MNRLYKTASIVVGSVIAQRIIVNFQQPQYTYADSIPDKKDIVVPTKTASVASTTSEEEDEDLELDPEKEDCPFCKHFLMSPCAKQFRRWSKCVDKCKEDETDFITVCGDYTAKLLDCTSSNTEYFKEMAAVTIEEESDDESEIEEGSEEIKEVSDSIVVDEKDVESESETKEK